MMRKGEQFAGRRVINKRKFIMTILLKRCKTVVVECNSHDLRHKLKKISVTMPPSGGVVASVRSTSSGDSHESTPHG